MDPDDKISNAFSVEGLLRPSTLFLDDFANGSGLFPPVQLDLPLIKLDNPYAPKESLSTDLRLPDLDSFAFAPPLEDIDNNDLSTDVSSPTHQLLALDNNDLWSEAGSLGPLSADIKFFTWERFLDLPTKEKVSPYISEAGPEVFDAALQLHAKEKGAGEAAMAGRVIRSDVLLSSLFNLGLGRSSVLFTYNERKRAFQQAIPDGRMTGCSLVLSQSLIGRFLEGGNTFRRLRDFTERTFTNSNSAFPAKVALADVVTAILSGLERHVIDNSTGVRSFLQLQHLFDRPQRVLHRIQRLVKAIRSAKTDERAAMIAFDEAQLDDQDDSPVHMITLKILSMVAEPWLESVAEWVGLRDEVLTRSQSKKMTFAQPIESGEEQNVPTSMIDFVFVPELMPAFVPPEDSQKIFQTGRGIHFLKTHHPDHPLASPETYGIVVPKLEWTHTWQSVEIVVQKTKAYEESVIEALRRYRDGKRGSHHQAPKESTKGLIDEDAQIHFFSTESIENPSSLFDRPPVSIPNVLADEVQALTIRTVSNTTSTESTMAATSMFAPLVALTPELSLFPLLRAQSRLVNASSIRLFFRSHDLRLHLSLQKQYHLFGDGVFASRLAQALFSPDLASAEHQRGRIRTGAPMGLKLGSRSTWPPESSELRLALMGLLSECYHGSTLPYQHGKVSGASGQTRKLAGKDLWDLPGNLSFSIRNVDPADIEKIMNPNSLHALDFLRLQYMPPPPLHQVITPSALDKYDHIFKFLLRIRRMLFVVSHLPRDTPNSTARELRKEAHQFVTAVASYSLNTGIDENWAEFNTFLDNIEERLRKEDETGKIGTSVIDGIDGLCAAHDKCLDRILFSLFLRKRQSQVYGLLCDIFEDILRFAKLTDDAPIWSDKATVTRVTELHTRLRGKIRVFMTVCRELTGKKGYGKGQSASEENTVDRLLLMLDMNGYYSKRGAAAVV